MASSNRTRRTLCSAANRDHSAACRGVLAALGLAFLLQGPQALPRCAEPFSALLRRGLGPAATVPRRAANSRVRWMTPLGFLRAAIPSAASLRQATSLLA